MPTPIKDRSGQVMVALIGLIVMLLIVVPWLVSMTVSESKQTIRAKRDTTAYYLAEAGIERGYWKLQEDPDYWEHLASATIAGYNFDFAYADVPSTAAPAGTYTVRLASYTLAGGPVPIQTQRVITAAGRDKDGRETATIDLIVQVPGIIRAPLQAYGVGVAGTGRIHWGPILSMSSMSFVGASVLRWPRKYARGQITAGPFNTDTNPAQPNFDTDNPNPHSEFWSFNEPPGVPDPPVIDLPYYKYLAQCATCAIAAGFPGGGIYYSTNIVVSNQKDTGLTVRYAEGTLKFTGCVATMGVIIAIQHLHFQGGACNVGQAPPGRYPHTVSIPDSAWMEYRKIDTAAAGEYPGDMGGPGSSGLSSNYTFGAADSNNSSSLTISHYGFAYSVTSWQGTGGTVIVGAVLAPIDAGGGAGGVKIYYQDDLGIRGTATGKYDRVNWDRRPGYWPPGLP